jgi:dephospho-CoA kinase
MLKVGLTGNIGSGKTAIASVFSTLGIPVFHADVKARKQFENEKIKLRIRKIFGDSVFSTSGEILRPALAELVFSNSILLDELNRLIHPGVRDDFQQWCLQHTEAPYILYEAAILFESGHYREMDKIICVTAPAEMRIRRVMDRDGLSQQEVEKRMASQWVEEKKVALADYVIKNDETEMVIKQVMETHEKLVQSSKFKIQN